MPMCYSASAFVWSEQINHLCLSPLLFLWLSSDLSSLPSPGGQSVFQCPEWAQPRKQRERRGKKRRGEEGYSRGMQEVSGRGVFKTFLCSHSDLIHTYVPISLCLCMPSVSYVHLHTLAHTHTEVCQGGCVKLLHVKDAQPWLARTHGPI